MLCGRFRGNVESSRSRAQPRSSPRPPLTPPPAEAEPTKSSTLSTTTTETGVPVEAEPSPPDPAALPCRWEVAAHPRSARRCATRVARVGADGSAVTLDATNTPATSLEAGSDRSRACSKASMQPATLPASRSAAAWLVGSCKPCVFSQPGRANARPPGRAAAAKAAS